MRNKHIKTLILIFSIFFCFNFSLTGQNYKIDYIGIVSSEIDQNMAKMTSDLYYTQLNEIQEFSVSDKRNDVYMTSIPSSQNLSSSNLSFFTEITKKDNSEKWIVTIHVINPLSNEEHTKKIEYDSYYKILMESKNTLKETLTQLLLSNTNGVSGGQMDGGKAEGDGRGASITSTESLSGTWEGEEFIDKIIIMRGGRGFIIFNNGASMNITVVLNNNSSTSKIIISQKGSSNASFYPNLPREIAMNAALEADPLEWTFSLSDNNTLSGTKKTLVKNGDGYTYSTETVKWKRIQ